MLYSLGDPMQRMGFDQADETSTNIYVGNINPKVSFLIETFPLTFISEQLTLSSIIKLTDLDKKKCVENHIKS